MAAPENNAFTVYLEDVFNQPYSEEDAKRRDIAGTFPRYDLARAYARGIVDRFIEDYLKEHPFNQDDLEFAYSMHGEQPYIEPQPEGEFFNGRAYFLSRVQALAGEQHTQ